MFANVLTTHKIGGNQFGPNCEPNFWTMGSGYPTMCFGTSLTTLSEHAKLIFQYYQVFFMWVIFNSF